MGNPLQTSTVSFLERTIAQPDRPTGVPASSIPAGGPPEVERRPPVPAGAAMATIDSDLSALGLVLLATASIFEGYKWLNAIPTSHSHLSRIVLSQPGAVAVAVCSLLAVAVLNSSARVQSRVAARRALWAAALLPATVALSVAVLDTAVTRYALGAADLVLAGVAVATLIPIGRGAVRVRRALGPLGAGEAGADPIRRSESATLSFPPFN